MQVQTPDFVDYAQTIVDTVSSVQNKIRVLYGEKDRINARSLIFSDFNVVIQNSANPASGLSVSYTFNTLPSITMGVARYNSIFIRMVLASNQSLYTLPDSSLASIKQILITYLAGGSYVYMTPTNPFEPILSNVDFIAEIQVPASSNANQVENAIQSLIKASFPVQNNLNGLLSVPRVPQPPNSTDSYPIVKGALPIDNFAKLAQISWDRIIENPSIVWKKNPNFPISHKWSFFNHTVAVTGSSGACWLSHADGQWTLQSSWIWPCVGLLDNFNSSSLVQFFSTFQNSADKIKPQNGNYFFNFDPSQPIATVLAYGIAASNAVEAKSPVDLEIAAREFYLTTRT